MSNIKEQTQETRTETFQLNVARFTDKKRGLDFNTYEGYVGKKQRKVTIKFRRDVKDIPTETCIITVKVTDMSLDTRSKYPVLWLHGFDKVEDLDTQRSTKAVDNFFGNDTEEKDEKDIPF